jgi:excisionase family DNA binding protein
MLVAAAVPPISDIEITEAQCLEEMKKFFRRVAHSQFAAQLATARQMWRLHPELVECESFPEPFLTAHIEVEGTDPEGFDPPCSYLSDGFEAHIAAMAQEVFAVNIKNVIKPQPEKVRRRTQGGKTYSVVELAVSLGLSQHSVRNGIKRGIIPHIRVGKRYLLPHAAIDEWLKNAGPRA